MPYFQRSFASALIIFVLLFSLCALPENVSAARRRCPEEAPDSLLTLYLKSDLIVVAAIQGEKVLKKTNEYEHGSYFDVEKILTVSDTLKGSKKNQASYVISQYESKDSKTISDDGSKMTYSEDEEAYPGIGQKALFFLVSSEESNSFQLADYTSAIKKLSDHELSVYLKRIKELKKITEAKKNQLAKLTEWLVELVEDPVTRDEGTSDLQASFMALSYEQYEESEESAEEENVDEAGAAEVSQKDPAFPDKDYRAANTSEIAKILTNSQKDRISSVLSHSINVHLAKLNNTENEEDTIAPDYELIMLVGHWNKTYLAMNSYAILQNSGTANARKTSYLLNLIAYLFEDEKLFSIVSNYEYAAGQSQNEMTEYPEEEEEAAPIGEVSDAPVSPEILTDPQPVEMATPEQTAETVIMPDKMENSAEKIEKEIRKITFKQYKEMLWDNFEKQYKLVIAQSLAAK